MRIAILGTGPVGIALGNAFIAAGHDVVYGSRSAEEDGLPRPSRQQQAPPTLPT